MQNFPNNIVPTSLYCNKYYYQRCAQPPPVNVLLMDGH